MSKLFLDDMRVPMEAFDYTSNPSYVLDGWDIVRCYDEFVAYVEKNGIPNIVSFDHDLGDEHYRDCDRWLEIKYDEYKEKTGYHCMKWLGEKCYDEKVQLPIVLCHSMNPVGKKNILDYAAWAGRKIDELISNG